MKQSLGAIAAAFNTRADSYRRNEWHRACAERLVALCELAAAGRVLDACTGTGFAALAAAHVVGPQGHVVGVDVSADTLRREYLDALDALQRQSPGELSLAEVLYAVGVR